MLNPNPPSNGNKIQLRYATKIDCPRLMELVQELADFEKAPHEVSVTLQEFEEAGFGSSPVWKAIVAEYEGAVQGFSLYYTRFSTWKGCRLYLEDFLVTEKYRGLGIGKKLFDATLAEASKPPYNGMVWQVLDWNEPAIKFYRKYEASLDPEWINGALSKEQVEQAVANLNL